MTGKIRMMSAGMGGASRYRVNPWGNQGGGNKKQGLPPTTNKPVQYVLRAINRRAYGTPQQRATVYYINQLNIENILLKTLYYILSLKLLVLALCIVFLS